MLQNKNADKNTELFDTYLQFYVYYLLFFLFQTEHHYLRGNRKRFEFESSGDGIKGPEFHT